MSSTSWGAVSGKIIGMVKDVETGDPLPGANIYLKGTSIGAATGLDGHYIIPRVPPGAYTLIVSYVGFQEYSQEIEVQAGQTIELDVELVFKVVQGQTVTVTAQMKGQMAAINRQLTSNSIVNVVSAERIQEVPDANAAEAISRLPGISLDRDAGEGMGVIIRGLSPKYNKITIGGVTIASTDATDRSSDLSMISPENLAGIEVYKALMPDMDGDALGGAVNLVLAKARERPEYMVRMFGGYNAQEKDLKQYKGYAKLSQRFWNNKLGLQASVNAERRNRGRDRLTAKFFQRTVPEEQRTVPEDSIEYLISSVDIEDRLETRERYGGSLIMDFEQSNSAFMFSNFYSLTDREIIYRRHEFDEGKDYPLVNPGIIDRNTQVLTNALSGKHPIFGIEADWTLSHSYSKDNQPLDIVMRFYELQTGSPVRLLDPEDFLVELSPDTLCRFYQSIYHKGVTIARRYAGELNINVPFNLGTKIAGYFKFGGKYTRLEKSNDEIKGKAMSGDFEQAGRADMVDPANWLDPEYDPGKVLNGLTELGLILDAEKIRDFYNQNKDLIESKASPFWGEADNYETKDNIFAGYVMAKVSYGQLLTFIPGVRYEAEDNDGLAHYRLTRAGWPKPSGDLREKKAHITNGYWLPMGNLRVNPLRWLDFRFAVTRTLSRPDFFFRVPYEYRSVQPGSTIDLGVPDLKTALSWNYDMYVSFHQSRLGLFTFGMFYKVIDDFSYRVRPYIETEEDAERWGLDWSDPRNKDRYLKIPINTSFLTDEPSTVRGLEIDLQTNLAFMSGFLKGFVFHANYTHIFSNSYLPYRREWAEFDENWNLIMFREAGLRSGPLPGQAENLANLSLGYDIGGFSARLSMFHQGKSLDIDGVGTLASEDRYVDAFTRWDLTVKHEINDHWSLFSNVVNITNEPDAQRQADTDKYRLLEYFGPMYDFGLQYTFK